jgi:single-strand DNA-binding protein
MQFTGRVTANAATRTVKEDKQVVNFTVAINQRWKTKDGEKKEKTAFVDCAYWRHAGLAEYLTKGAVVEIQGWMEAQAYQSTTHGLQARLSCTCDTIKLFTPAAKNQEQAKKEEAKPVTTGANPDEDDLPF